MKHMAKVISCLFAAVAALGSFGGTTVYVDCTSQGAAEPYATPESAAKTITAAMTYVGTLGDDAYPVEIVIAKGTYTENNFTLGGAITVRGDTGNPADVVINDNTAGRRAFAISHADAVVRDLTIKGTGTQTTGISYYGGHVNMTAGTVENCIIRDGCSNARAGSIGNSSYGRGGNVYMTGGRLVRCQILGGRLSVNGSAKNESYEYGAGVFAGGTAVVDSCLIKDNNPDATQRGWGGGVYAEGSATVVNCTIVGNRVNANTAGAGVYVNSDQASVVNCVMFNNGGTDVTEFGGANLGCFFHCASSVTNTGCATWRLITEEDLPGFGVNDFHPSLSSPLVDGGSEDAQWYPADATAVDLDGLPRKSGAAIDIGCYEADQSRVNVGGSVSSDFGFEGTNLTLTATAKGGTGGPYRYRWDLGNGVTNETTEAVSAYAWPDSGLYVVKVSASDDGGKSWSDWSTLPKKVVIAPDTVYVSGTGKNPTFPYKTRETAATKISTVLAAFANNVSEGLCAVDGLTVRVLSGTVTDTGMKLAAAVTIVGDTGNPADVIINDNVKGSRAFLISHAGAVVRDLTITGDGTRTTGSSYYGGHVNMTAGTVENCVIRDGYSNAAAGGPSGAKNGDGRGGNVYMSGGRLVRCQILGGHLSEYGGGNNNEYGAGVFAGGTAVVDSCLIKDNNPGATGKGWGGGVYAEGSATVVNCTIVGNRVDASTAGAGVYVASDQASVVNCVMFSNGGTDKTEFGGANLGCFVHCASSVTNTGCATWRLITEDDFPGSKANDFHPSLSSPLVDGGSEDAQWYPADATAVDLDGLPRKSGGAIDIGCYEADQSRVNVSGVVSADFGFEGMNYTFTARAKGGTGGPYRYRWDLGNGVTNETTESVSAYAWADSGLYVVKVQASDDGGASWGSWATLPTKVVIAPDTVYVSGMSAKPTFPYKTPETAAKKISTVLAAFTNNVSSGLCAVDGLTVRVLSGTVTDTGMKLAAAVTIVGDTGNPADVIINDDVKGSRAFLISHAGAVVRDLTITGNGTHTTGSDYYGGHVNMTAGTVENCIIRDGCSNAAAGSMGNPSYGRGGNVYMSGGRLVRCQILGGRLSDNGGGRDGYYEYGAGVFAGDTAVVDSCLIKDNNPGATGKGWGGGVYAEGSATVVNCTIVGNRVDAGTAGAGVYVASDQVGVVNTVLFDNGGTDKTEFGGANLDRFVRCASSTNNEECATWQVIDETAFRDWASRDTDLGALVPAAGKPLVGTGTDAAGYMAAGGTATLDLLGKPRRKGRRIDIGCLESQRGGGALILR